MIILNSSPDLIFLDVFFCDLAISDFYKLESISYKGKSVCNLMKQAILKRYVGGKFVDLTKDRAKAECDKFFAKIIEMDRRKRHKRKMESYG